jgi:hypothetical protein
MIKVCVKVKDEKYLRMEGVYIYQTFLLILFPLLFHPDTEQ